MKSPNKMDFLRKQMAENFAPQNLTPLHLTQQKALRKRHNVIVTPCGRTAVTGYDFGKNTKVKSQMEDEENVGY